ncbi:MAG: hypothetical protein HY720_02480 [Planctomycetes bacterium]|nr:hypothetical protein [Planctomycetota bacterium]
MGTISRRSGSDSLHGFSWAILALALAGCATSEKYEEETIEFTVGPAYREESIEVGGKKTARVDSIWPLYHEEHDEETGRHSYAVRPLFHYSYDDEGEHEQVMALWPAGWYRVRPDETNRWLLPAYWSRDTLDPIDGTEDTDTIFLFPFFYWGDTTGVHEEAERTGSESDRGPYFAFFPFYGHLKGYFGKDNLRFWMFPFGYWRANDDLYYSHNIGWPFYSQGAGPKKVAKSFLPLWGEGERFGVWKRKFYAWPFVHVQKNHLNTPYPEDAFLVWPFYGEAVSEGRRAEQYIWPFFNFIEDQRQDAYEIDAPWPFFVTYESPRVRALRVWPFYGYQEDSDGYRRDFAAFPLFWRWYNDTKYYQKETYFLVPFYKSEDYSYRDGTASYEMRLWPLFRVKKDRDGSVRHSGLTLLFFDDFEPAGFETLYEPLVQLYTYREDPEKGTDLSVLGPVYERREAPGVYAERFLFWQWAHFTQEGRPEEKRFTFLGGLFEWIERGGDAGVRLFWLPPLGLDEAPSAADGGGVPPGRKDEPEEEK